MVDSILDSVKITLGLTSDYTAFDQEIIIHVNSVLSTLNQLGLGPSEGLMIEDNTTVWEDFFDDVRLNSIKTYVSLRLKLLFDPPATSFAITAINDQIKELEWRLNAVREEDKWWDAETGLSNSDLLSQSAAVQLKEEW